MKRHVYRVLRAGDQWQVRRNRARHPVASGADKESAILVAQALQLLSGKPGQVIVHGKNGRIQKEWTYRGDPHRTPG